MTALVHATNFPTPSEPSKPATRAELLAPGAGAELLAPGTRAEIRTPAGPLDPILDCLAAVRGRHGEAPVHGIAPGLVVRDPTGWIPATRFADGDALPDLLDAARRRWAGSPHAGAALAWKSYTYWLALPAVLGYAYARRVPLMSAENTLVRLHVSAPFLEIGLRSPRVAVLPDDPLATPTRGARPDVRVIEDLPRYLRETLLDRHLAPMLDALAGTVRLGRRTLLGSLASGVGYALVRAEHVLPAPVPETAHTLLSALGIEDLAEVSAGSTEPAASQVRRHTCCLAFTLPEPKVCRGCCIRDAGCAVG